MFWYCCDLPPFTKYVLVSTILFNVIQKPKIVDFHQNLMPFYERRTFYTIGDFMRKFLILKQTSNSLLAYHSYFKNDRRIVNYLYAIDEFLYSLYEIDEFFLLSSTPRRIKCYHYHVSEYEERICKICCRFPTFTN